MHFLSWLLLSFIPQVSTSINPSQFRLSCSNCDQVKTSIKYPANPTPINCKVSVIHCKCQNQRGCAKGKLFRQPYCDITSYYSSPKTLDRWQSACMRLKCKWFQAESVKSKELYPVAYRNILSPGIFKGKGKKNESAIANRLKVEVFCQTVGGRGQYQQWHAPADGRRGRTKVQKIASKKTHVERVATTAKSRNEHKKKGAIMNQGSRIAGTKKSRIEKSKNAKAKFTSRLLTSRRQRKQKTVFRKPTNSHRGRVTSLRKRSKTTNGRRRSKLPIARVATRKRNNKSRVRKPISRMATVKRTKSEGRKSTRRKSRTTKRASIGSKIRSATMRKMSARRGSTIVTAARTDRGKVGRQSPKHPIASTRVKNKNHRCKATGNRQCDEIPPPAPCATHELKPLICTACSHMREQRMPKRPIMVPCALTMIECECTDPSCNTYPYQYISICNVSFLPLATIEQWERDCHGLKDDGDDELYNCPWFQAGDVNRTWYILYHHERLLPGINRMPVRPFRKDIEREITLGEYCGYHGRFSVKQGSLQGSLICTNCDGLPFRDRTKMPNIIVTLQCNITKINCRPSVPQRGGENVQTVGVYCDSTSINRASILKMGELCRDVSCQYPQITYTDAESQNTEALALIYSFERGSFYPGAVSRADGRMKRILKTLTVFDQLCNRLMGREDYYDVVGSGEEHPFCAAPVSDMVMHTASTPSATGPTPSFGTSAGGTRVSPLIITNVICTHCGKVSSSTAELGDEGRGFIGCTMRSLRCKCAGTPLYRACADAPVTCLTVCDITESDPQQTKYKGYLNKCIAKGCKHAQVQYLTHNDDWVPFIHNDTLMEGIIVLRSPPFEGQIGMPFTKYEYCTFMEQFGTRVFDSFSRDLDGRTCSPPKKLAEGLTDSFILQCSFCDSNQDELGTIAVQPPIGLPCKLVESACVADTGPNLVYTNCEVNMFDVKRAKDLSDTCEKLGCLGMQAVGRKSERTSVLLLNNNYNYAGLLRLNWTIPLRTYSTVSAVCGILLDKYPFGHETSASIVKTTARAVPTAAAPTATAPPLAATTSAAATFSPWLVCSNCRIGTVGYYWKLAYPVTTKRVDCRFKEIICKCNEQNGCTNKNLEYFTGYTTADLCLPMCDISHLSTSEVTSMRTMCKNLYCENMQVVNTTGPRPVITDTRPVVSQEDTLDYLPMYQWPHILPGIVKIPSIYFFLKINWTNALESDICHIRSWNWYPLFHQPMPPGKEHCGSWPYFQTTLTSASWTYIICTWSGRIMTAEQTVTFETYSTRLCRDPQKDDCTTNPDSYAWTIKGEWTTTEWYTASYSFRVKEEDYDTALQACRTKTVKGVPGQRYEYIQPGGLSWSQFEFTGRYLSLTNAVSRSKIINNAVGSLPFP